MAYIGNEPTSAAFVTDLFSGNGSTTTFTMSVAPANTASVLIAISGVVQSPDTYSINATTLTFSPAPPAGTGNISVRYLGIPASNVTTTAYRTVTEFTATAGQTTFSVPSYTVGYIDVYRNGVRLGTADYTATSGTSVVLANAAAVGDLVATESFYVSSVLNAIPATGGSINTIYLDAGNANGTGALLTPSGTTAQRPASPIVGMQRWNTTIGGMEVYIGSSNWQTIASTAYTVDYLIAAGGGGGGSGYGQGGGGAGGLLTASSLSVSPGTAYTITLGAGGAGSPASSGTWPTARATSGSNSTAFSVTAIGGGGGAAGSAGTGGNGGSGGGGGNSGGAGGAATSGQGFAGGTGGGAAPNYPGGGGGGAGAVGTIGAGAAGGNGGAGLQWSDGNFYCGGGGGGLYDNGGSATNTGGLAGTGGGGRGGVNSRSVGVNGTINSGGGGGASGGYESVTALLGASGGSGIVVIRYAGSVQRATGGTVTITGGYVYHTFTTSGTYTA
jgi:hypothetical protein